MNNDAAYARAKALIAEEGLSERAACKSAGIARSTFKNRKLAEASAAPETSATGNGAVTEEQVLRDHGIDPDDVVIHTGRASRWGNPDHPNQQLRVNYTRKVDLIQVPTLEAFEPPDLDCIEEFAEGVVLFRADPHLPFNNKALNRAVLRWLNLSGCRKIVHLGDTTDSNEFSTHRTHRDFKTTPNESNQAATNYFREEREAAPDAEIDVLLGNHDVRLQNLIQDKFDTLSGLTRGGLPDDEDGDPEALSFRRLWRLDDLGINLIEDDYKLGSINVAPELTARHGYLTGNNSERKLLETHGRSQVHGHDHRGSVIYRTKHDPLDIRVAMSCGTEAEVNPRGLGYRPDPDWTPGVGLGHVWDDGLFVVNFVPFIDNYLLFPTGERISGE